MRKKIILTVIVVIALVLPNCLIFSGCKTVSTLEELKGASGHGVRVKLKNDIDCNFETIAPLRIAEVDGNGFTIKNAVVTPDGSVASFFITDKLTNITFDGITVKGSGVSDAVAVSSGQGTIENVKVQNCTIESTQKVRAAGYAVYIGAIYGGVKDKFGDAQSSERNTRSIKNCSVENTTIVLNEYKGDKLNQADINMGIVAGRCDDVTGCYAKGCKITANSSGMYCEPHVGGIVGDSIGVIENCYAVDNEINANALYYQDNVLHAYSTSTAYAGGIVGYYNTISKPDMYGQTVEIDGKNVTLCYSENNHITVKCTGDIGVGGILGYAGKMAVSQCYAKGNEIIMDKYVSGNKDDSVKRRLGGLIGSAVRTTISSCFVYNDGGLFEYTFPSFDSNSKVAGLVAGFNGIIVMRCATYNTEDKLNAPMKDEFCPVAVENASKCYISSNFYGNACSCELLDEGFWDSPNALRSTLGLSSAYWKFDKGVPYLDFTE